MRLFIAICFDEETKSAIAEVQENLRLLDRRANFTRRENLHLTLAFLGEVSAEKVPDIKSAMGKTEVLPMNLVFDRVGAFHREGYDTCWIGLRKNRALENMQFTLAENLRQAGFVLEKRRFQPHLTIARKAVLPGRLQEFSLLPEAFCARAERISLMESTRENGKLCYTPLFTR